MNTPEGVLVITWKNGAKVTTKCRLEEVRFGEHPDADAIAQIEWVPIGWDKP